MPINYNDYPPNWKTEIRPAVLARAKSCCEECGIKNHSVIKRLKNDTYRFLCATDWDMINSRIKYSHSNLSESLKYHGCTKIILTIAHLDHDKFNLDVSLERLKALCQRCHLRLDINHHVRNRKYGRNHNRKEQTKIQF